MKLTDNSLESLQQWWLTMTKVEKSALLTLGSIMGAIFLLNLAIVLGSAFI